MTMPFGGSVRELANRPYRGVGCFISSLDMSRSLTALELLNILLDSFFTSKLSYSIHSL